jgi:hypothetical protein
VAGSGGGGGRGGGGHGRGNGTGGRGPKKTDECHQCGKLGHWARECQSKPKKEQANVAHEEEASLMVARTTMFQYPTDEDVLAAAFEGPMVAASGDAVAAVSGSVVAAATDGAMAAASRGVVAVATSDAVAVMPVTDVAVALSAMEILEKKMFVQLQMSKDHNEAKIWILDMGAMNHMSSSRGAFTELDTRVQGMVRLGDDSAARIEGLGKVQLVSKNGEKRMFEGVYYIPQLMTNIISVGQLDEDGYEIFIDGGV